MQIFIVFERTVLFYIIIEILYRFMGKREVGELGMVDVIVSILIAQMAAMSIDDTSNSIFISLVPIITLTLIQIISSYLSIKYAKIRELFDGKESIIINKGIINYKEMLKQRYSITDLLGQLREKGISNIKDVNFAILESSGRLSVFKKNDDSSYPFPIIIEGKIDIKSLNNINKDKKWLLNILNKNKLKVEDVFYLFYKNKELYIIRNNDLLK